MSDKNNPSVDVKKTSHDNGKIKETKQFADLDVHVERNTTVGKNSAIHLTKLSELSGLSKLGIETDGLSVMSKSNGVITALVDHEQAATAIDNAVKRAFTDGKFDKKEARLLKGLVKFANESIAYDQEFSEKEAGRVDELAAKIAPAKGHTNTQGKSK